jgi:hypothetical protein
VRPEHDRNDLLRRADAAMYEAKARGKNLVVVGVAAGMRGSGTTLVADTSGGAAG